jgi:hypothetical protein
MSFVFNFPYLLLTLFTTKKKAETSTLQLSFTFIQGENFSTTILKSTDLYCMTDASVIF